MDASKLARMVRENAVANAVVHGPFGDRQAVYVDYAASGRLLKAFDHFMATKVHPSYSNVHSDTTEYGRAMNALVEQSRRQVAAAVGADRSQYAVVFAGAGATAAANIVCNLVMRQDAEHGPNAGPGDRPTVVAVFVSALEHNSNTLIWREAPCELVVIGEDASGRLDLLQLEHEVATRRAAHPQRLLVGSFTAGSNVTGITLQVDEIATLMHKHQGLVFFDYAAAASYLPIAMEPAGKPGTYKDGVFLSPHKFIGGPGSSGVLVARRDLFDPTLPPTRAGGGTVIYVTPYSHLYEAEPETREEAGTPNVLGNIRCGLAFGLMHEAHSSPEVHRHEKDLMKRLIDGLSAIPEVIMLGSDRPAFHDLDSRLGIFSFLMLAPAHLTPATTQSSTGSTDATPGSSPAEPGGQRLLLHQNFVAKLLNDLYGIQSRSGCSCAGPYAFGLLTPLFSEHLRTRATFGPGSSSAGSPASTKPPGGGPLGQGRHHADAKLGTRMSADPDSAPLTSRSTARRCSTLPKPRSKHQDLHESSNTLPSWCVSEADQESYERLVSVSSGVSRARGDTADGGAAADLAGGVQGAGVQPSQLLTEMEMRTPAMFTALTVTDRATLTYLRSVSASRGALTDAAPAAADTQQPSPTRPLPPLPPPPPPPLPAAVAGRWVCASSSHAMLCGVVAGAAPATGKKAGRGLGDMPLLARADVSAVLVRDVELDANLPPGVLAAAALFDTEQLKQRSLGERTLLEITAMLGEGYGFIKPGWTRVSIKFATTIEEVDYLIQAIKQVAEHGWRLLPLYEMDRGGQWNLRKDAVPIAKRAGIAAHTTVVEARQKLHPTVTHAASSVPQTPRQQQRHRLMLGCFRSSGTAPPVQSVRGADHPTPSGASAPALASIAAPMLTAEDDAFLSSVKALQPLLAAAPEESVAWDEPEGRLTQSEVFSRALAEASELLAHAERWVKMLVEASQQAQAKEPSPDLPLLADFAPGTTGGPLPANLTAVTWWLAPSEAAANLLVKKHAGASGAQ